ncbi:YccJ family protein [Shigella flexneri]
MGQSAQHVTQIAEAIFELAKMTKRRQKKSGKKAAMPFPRTGLQENGQDALFWGEQTIERKNV